LRKRCALSAICEPARIRAIPFLTDKPKTTTTRIAERTSAAVFTNFMLISDDIGFDLGTLNPSACQVN
jgi:hypothetical protein